MAPTTERDQAQRREQAEAAVGPLLARANLYRLRGQWNEAVSVCTEALRVAPQSPTAHSLLGDIYEAQGKLDDAIQWFSMAVDLHPGNAPDRAKLDRVLAAKRAVVTADEKTKTANAMLASTAVTGIPKEKTLDKTIEWFDRKFPPGRSDSIVRLILLVAVAIAGVIAVSAAFVYFTISRERAAATFSPTNAASITTSDLRQNSYGAGSTPLINKVPTVVTPTPTPTVIVTAAANSSTTSSSNTPPTSPGSRGRSLATAITGTLGSVITVHSAQSLDGVVQISLELATQVIDETREQTRERILRVAAQAAYTAATTETKAQKIVVTVALLGGTPAFRGEVLASSLHSRNPAVTAPGEFAGLFTAVQWNSSLSTGKETAAALP